MLTFIWGGAGRGVGSSSLLHERGGGGGLSHWAWGVHEPGGCRALLAPSFTSPSRGSWVPCTCWTGTYMRALPTCLPQACTLARRNAEVFLKYIHRNNVSMPSAASHTRGPEQQVKGQGDTCRPPPQHGPEAVPLVFVQPPISWVFSLDKKELDVGWHGL